MSQASLDSLFLNAVSSALQGNRVHWAPLSAELWRNLFWLAEQQKLLPLLVDAVCECTGVETDAGYLAARATAKRQVLLQTQKDLAFRKVYRQLQDAGIDALVVKGCLCRSVYPNGVLRISADEDLLVPEDAFAQACQVLAEVGLVAAPGAAFENASEIGWRSPDGLLYLELHKALFAPESLPFGLFQSFFSNVFSRSQTYPLDETAAVCSLSPHDHLLYLLLHAMKHFIHSGFGLRQICDVGLWAVRWEDRIDWALLAQQVQNVHAKAFCAALFEIAQQRLAISWNLPACWRGLSPDPEPLLQDILDGGVYGSSTKSRQHTARITRDAVAAQLQGKRRRLRTAIFPPAKDLSSDYPVLKTHPSLLPLFWQKRLAQYLLHAVGSKNDHPAETLRLGRQRLALLQTYGILEEADPLSDPH